MNQDRIPLDPGSQPLSRLLGQPLELPRFLHLAIGLAAALGRVHAQGLIHKDIKPANVLVDAASGGVRLTGFGLASRLPRERQAPAPPEVIAGTLAYMAPEQTGRMNRSIDARSDLYALGVTLYEMLTGTLPFSAADPLEWVHCHIARQPVPPAERRPEIAGPLSAIVMKLLAKTPEERYQTAAGVEADLRTCLAAWQAAWQARGRIAPFPLGRRDVPDRLLVPEKLYGRERAVATLLEAFDRVVTRGRPELVLVSGYAGIGKSSVVNELHKALVPTRGLFASGKFDQYRRDTPYACLAEAFQALFRQLLVQDESELGRWRQALQEAVGSNGQLLAALIPELELVIGKQPPVPELPSEDEQNRFHRVVGRFVGAFAQAGHPLALFLDDLQWLDVATLELLEVLITQADVQHLLLVGAYRDNEVDASHPLMRMPATIRKAGAPVQEIVLAPLTLDDTVHLVADTLRCKQGRARSLGQLVHAKTGGNPFFAHQFLIALADEGLLAFDRGAAAWSWDLKRIRVKGYTDNVVDLLLGKLNRLPDATRETLKQLACLGNAAGIGILSTVHGHAEESIHTALREVVRAGLVFRLDGSYTFPHDRIREAAYSLIPESERAAAHLRIGSLLAARTAPADIEGKIFEIVDHLNRGVALIDSQAQRERLAELNLIAGRRAKDSSACASALTYLAAARALLAEDCWERRYELAFALELCCARCEHLTGALEAAEQRLMLLSRRAATLVDFAAVTCAQIELYTSLDQGARGVDASLDYLRRIGVTWPPHPTNEDVASEYERLWRRLGNRPIEDLRHLPPVEAPDWRASLDVLNRAGISARFVDRNLFCLIYGRLVNLIIEHGSCDSAPMAYLMAGGVLIRRFGDYRAGVRFGKLGFELVEGNPQTPFKARFYLNYAHLINPWIGPLRSGLPLLRRGLDAAQEAGDLAFVPIARHFIVMLMLAAGERLEDIQRETESALASVRKARFDTAIDLLVAELLFVRMLRGLTPEFGSLNDPELRQSRFEQDLEGQDLEEACGRVGAASIWILKLQARVYADDCAGALEAAAKVEQLLSSEPTLLTVAEYHFHAGLAHAACHGFAAPDQRRQHLDALVAHHHQLETWAQNSPDNFGGRAALLGAEIARIEDHELAAERLYEQAIRQAHDNGLVQHESLAHEHAARFHAARGFDTIAQAYLHKARAGYLRWGALGKLQQLDRSFPRLAEPEALRSIATIGAPVAQLDVLTAVKASQALSGEIDLDQLLQTLMAISLEHAGAERGLLLLHDGTWRIEAEAATRRERIEITLHRVDATPADLPGSVLQYVVRTGQRVLLDDAASPNLFSADSYLQRQRPRSLLCLPLLKQTRLIGALYLENNLTPCAFTPERLAMLELLAAQAAISLENARLYADLRQRETRIRRLVDANIIGIVFSNVEKGVVTDANDAYLALVGYSREDLRAGRLRREVLTLPDDHAAVERALEQFRTQGRIQPYERELIRKDGSRVPVLMGGARLEQSPNEAVAFVLDLSERREAERRQKLLLDELNHRVKNTLATVQALAEQTLRTAESTEAFCEAFQSRLMALSQTHNLLTQGAWQGVNLRALLQMELAPYDGDRPRFGLQGEDIRLGPVAAVTVGMAFHELATNAAKYGALSVPAGEVRVAWEVDAQRRLHLTWLESGGPPVAPPRRRGFGSRLLEKGLAYEFAGQVHLEFHPAGLRCTMDISMERVSIH